MVEISGGRMMADKLAAMAAQLGKAHEVRVGFLEGATYPDGTPVAMVAAINNFGAPEAGIPPRPFFTNMVAEKSPGWGNAFAAILKTDDFDAAKALELMGEGMAGQLREAIIDFSSVPNSPVTDLLKQRFPMREGMTFADVLQARRDVAAGETAPAGKPLAWTGEMLNRVDKEVR